MGIGVTTMPTSVRTQPSVSMKYLRNFDLTNLDQPYMGEPGRNRNRGVAGFTLKPLRMRAFARRNLAKMPRPEIMLLRRQSARPLHARAIRSRQRPVQCWI